MNDIIRKKLNILVHLAKVDGKFHDSERRLLKEFMIENDLDANDFKLVSGDSKKITFEADEDKKEILFLSLKLIQADEVIHDKEIEYCKNLANNLGYSSAIVEKFARVKLDRDQFENEILAFKMKN